MIPSWVWLMIDDMKRAGQKHTPYFVNPFLIFSPADAWSLAERGYHVVTAYLPSVGAADCICWCDYPNGDQKCDAVEDALLRPPSEVRIGHDGRTDKRPMPPTANILTPNVQQPPPSGDVHVVHAKGAAH